MRQVATMCNWQFGENGLCTGSIRGKIFHSELWLDAEFDAILTSHWPVFHFLAHLADMFDKMFASDEYRDRVHWSPCGIVHYGTHVYSEYLESGFEDSNSRGNPECDLLPRALQLVLTLAVN